MKRQYKTYVCPKCGAGCVELPGLVHVCEEKHVEDDKAKDMKREKKTTKKISKK